MRPCTLVPAAAFPTRTAGLPGCWRPASRPRRSEPWRARRALRRWPPWRTRPWRRHWAATWRARSASATASAWGWGCPSCWRLRSPPGGSSSAEPPAGRRPRRRQPRRPRRRTRRRTPRRSRRRSSRCRRRPEQRRRGRAWRGQAGVWPKRAPAAMLVAWEQRVSVQCRPDVPALGAVRLAAHHQRAFARTARAARGGGPGFVCTGQALGVVPKKACAGFACFWALCQIPVKSLRRQRGVPMPMCAVVVLRFVGQWPVHRAPTSPRQACTHVQTLRSCRIDQHTCAGQAPRLNVACMGRCRKSA